MKMKKTIGTLLLMTLTTCLLAGDKVIYSVNFKKSETFKVSGGVFNSEYWEVRNDSAISLQITDCVMKKETIAIR